MPEALSQNQIDELLRKMRTGTMEEAAPEPKSKEKLYDFSSPKKFTKDQLKSLNTLYENFSRVLASYFTTILRSVCEITISQIEEQRYQEFNNALPDTTLVGIISCQAEGGTAVDTTLMLELPTAFGFLLIDRLMGGSLKAYAPERDYTEIETALIRLILENTTNYLQEAWSGYFPLNTNLSSIETNGRLLQAFSPQDVVVIVSIDIKEDSFHGTANICMPAENLELIINSFSSKYSHGTKQQDPEKERQKQEVLMDYLKQTDLDVTAYLDICQMSFGEILQLQVNDVICLNRRIDDDISVYVEGVPWYTARMGEFSSKRALKLVESIDDTVK